LVRCPAARELRGDAPEAQARPPAPDDLTDGFQLRRIRDHGGAGGRSPIADRATAQTLAFVAFVAKRTPRPLADLFTLHLGQRAKHREHENASGRPCVDQLQDRYEGAIEHLVELTNQPSLFDPDRTILQQNLFGVDLNEEAVEICRLSIWIKTAKRGKVLADLNENILVGNSVVDDPGVDPRALDWATAFPAAHSQGGFDVVKSGTAYTGPGESLSPSPPSLWRD